MFVAPNSAIKVLRNVPLTNNNRNTIYFGTRAEQTTYFSNLAKHTFTGCTYIKETKKVRVDKKADDLYDCNYIMYQNAGFSNKWFYAYITEVEYVNNVCCNISFEIDEKQTWLLNLDYKIMPSFVEREHVTDDTIGANLIDEGLEYGEYIHKSYSKTNLFSNLAFVVAISDMSPLLPDGITATPRVYDKIYSGLIYWAFSSDNISGLNAFIKKFSDAGKADAIALIFTIPIAFLPDHSDGQIMSGESAELATYEFNLNYDTIDGYTPKNKKLFCYPYNFLSVSNNQGNIAEFRFEDFYLGTSGKPTFRIRSNIAPNPSVVCTPINYKFDAFGEVPEYGLTLSGFPLCSWNTDVYKNWLAQNTANMALGAVGGVAGIVGGLATGNLVALGAGVMSVASQLAQVTKASKQPDQVRGNTNNGSYNIAHNRQDFYFMQMNIKSQYAKIIDDFLSVYGYKVNAIKVPNVNTRPHWNYVKTNGVTLVGINNDTSIPADSMKKLSEMYDNGITFWKHGSEVGNYNLNNAI